MIPIQPIILPPTSQVGYFTTYPQQQSNSTY